MFGFIGNIGPWELIFILLIALIVVGPGKLPEVAKGIGKATREFKKATSGVQKEINDVMKFDDDKPTLVKKEKDSIVKIKQEVLEEKAETPKIAEENKEESSNQV